MIDLINLTKDYGTTIAVNKLNLHVASGEIYGFIGPNGAGKTTTIRMMGGIIEPSSGSIIIDGINMKENPVGAKKLLALSRTGHFFMKNLPEPSF
jgi:ABC-2 type transport system ATP-binding protein